MPTNSDQLDEFSEMVAERFLARFPEWRPWVARRTHQDGTPGTYWTVEVPNPRGSKLPALGIWTAEGEVTIRFDMWHSHFGAWDTEEQAVTDSLDFLESFLNDRVWVVVCLDTGGRWVGSFTAIAIDDVKKHRPSGAVTARVLSWRGTADQVVST